MELSILKKLRLNAALTQKQVAKEVGVSQPNYQRWESGSASIPEAKVKKLAKALGATPDEIFGRPKAFDLFGIDGSIEDSRTYFGEIAVHFKSNNDSVLLPVSEQARSDLYNQMTSTSKFISLDSLDNRIICLRRDAIKDIYISSEAYDYYGPEHDRGYKGYLGVHPDDDFWHIIEEAEDPEGVIELYGEERVDEVLDEIFVSDEKIKQLVSEGNIKEEDYEKVKEKINKEESDYYDRATETKWQFSSGEIRSENIYEDEEIYNILHGLDESYDDFNEPIHISVEGYHKSIFILKNSIDYISAPLHKYNIGELICMEDMLDEEIKPSLELVD